MLLWVGLGGGGCCTRYDAVCDYCLGTALSLISVSPYPFFFWFIFVFFLAEIRVSTVTCHAGVPGMMMPVGVYSDSHNEAVKCHSHAKCCRCYHTGSSAAGSIVSVFVSVLPCFKTSFLPPLTFMRGKLACTCRRNKAKQV